MRTLVFAVVSLFLISTAACAQYMASSNTDDNPPGNSIGKDSNWSLDWGSGNIYDPKSARQRPRSPGATVIASSNLSTHSAVVYADQYSGSDFGARSDFGAKIDAACAALPSAGGTVDARGLYGSQTMSTTIDCGPDSKAITFLLGPGTITVSGGAQFHYYSNTKIIGAGWSQGGYPYGTHFEDTASHTFFLHGSANIPEGVEIADLSYRNVTSGSTGVDYSQNLMSRLDNVFISADIGYVVGGTPACACYNLFNNVQAWGHTYGARYLRYANQNQSFGGTVWGPTGLYIASTAFSNQFYSLDSEGSHTPFEIAGTGNTFFAPYLEADGPIILDSGANSNAFFGAGGIIEGDSFIDNSGNTTNYKMLLGGGGGAPGAWPNATAVSSTYYWGGSIDGGYNDKVGLSVNNSSDWSELNLTFFGQMRTVYGQYGHSPLHVGSLTSYGGDIAYGKKSLSAFASPSTPVITQGGTPGSTSATYHVVCHDRNGGVTLPSAAGSTTTGNATLSDLNYNIISWKAEDGCANWDILKGDTTRSIATAQSPPVAVGSPATISFKDTGQMTADYMSPSRNSTGDEVIGGRLIEGCAGTTVLTGGTGSVSDACITGSRPVICTDNTAISAAAVSCVPSAGSLSIHGSGTDRIGWAQL